MNIFRLIFQLHVSSIFPSKHQIFKKDGWCWKKKSSTQRQAVVMENMAASTLPGYFRKSPPVASRAVFYAGRTKVFFFFYFGVFIITCCFRWPLIFVFASCRPSSSKQGMKIKSNRGGSALNKPSEIQGRNKEIYSAVI